MHTFIVHARADEFFVRQIAGVLERFGFSTWWDASYESVESIQRNVHDAIGYAHAMIFVVSPQSVESRSVQAVIELARDFRIPIIPVLRTRRRDLVPREWESFLEQTLAFDASDPEELDHVLDLLLSRLEAIVDKSPPRYVSAHHILREMNVDEHFGLSAGAPTIRTQIEEVVSEFGPLAGSLDLFDRIEESLIQNREATSFCEGGQRLEPSRAVSPRTDLYAGAGVAALTCEIDARRSEIEELLGEMRSRLGVLRAGAGVERAAENDDWGWVRASAGTHLTAIESISSSFWPEPITRFRRGADDAEISQNYREITDALSRVAASGRDRRDKSERLLSELGLQSLSTLLTQVIVRAIEARPAESVSVVVSEAVQATLLSAEVADASATGLPKGMIVDLIDILDSNTNLAISGMRPVVVRPLWRDVEKGGCQHAAGGAVSAQTAYSKGKMVVVGVEKPLLDQSDLLVGLANLSMLNLTTRPQ